MSNLSSVTTKVENILKKEFNGFNTAANGWMQIPYETTNVSISCHDFSGSVVVRVTGVINSNCKFKKDIYEWIAKKNLDLIFGSIIHTDVSGGGNLTAIQCNILGDNLDSDELMTAISCAATTANELDEEFQANFGGKRFID